MAPNYKEKAMMRLMMAAVILLSAVAMAFGGQAGGGDKGPEQILLPGGSRGPVPFPHRDHQNRLQDCMICHHMFGQEPGSIEKLKADGQLGKKAVMNKLCIKCHRAQKTAGRPAGPLTCSQCHQRE